MTAPPATERGFDKYAIKGAYHWRDIEGGLWRMNAYTRARYELVVRHLAPLGRSGSVLDVGCGDGALAGLIHQTYGCQVVGVDTGELAISLARTEIARRNYNCEFELVHGYSYPFSTERFDAAVCSDVIEHVADPEALLREIWRLLKPKGALVLTTPIRMTEHPIDKQHVREWFPDEFVAFCAKVFGHPVKMLSSHPVVWYELYALDRRWLGGLARLAINAAALIGRNPFSERSTAWRCMTTQTLVLQKT